MMKQTAAMFFYMNPKQRTLITQKQLCQCFLKISLQPKGKISWPKRYKFICLLGVLD